MTDLRTLLSREDKQMMSDYVTQFATDGDDRHADIDTLLREWNWGKSQYLYQMFGNQFKIQKTLVYNKPEDKLYDELRNKFNSWGSACSNFRRTFDRFLWEHRVDLGQDYYKLQMLMDINALLKTCYEDDEFSVNAPEGRVIKVQKGCRPMRIISKVAKAYGGLEGLEEFQNEVSVVLTQKKLTGVMTLSIHPMDYMTMSHNDCGWSSCMDWTDKGCYCRGTVEMMNSDCVVVAYLASDDDMTFRANGKRYSWNNKKWRELFVVNENVITGVKGYPYQNSDLVKLVNSWLRELAEQNLGWKFDKENTRYRHKEWLHVKHDGAEDEVSVKLSFESNTMYNDFGTIEHYAILGNHTDGNICTNYSGAEMCLMCGSTDAYFEGEGYLMCQDCDSPIYCQCCGERIDGDDVYELDGDEFCYSCYQDRVYTDVMSDEDHDINNSTTVYLLPEGADPDTFDWYTDDVYCMNAYYTSGRTWRRWFKTDEVSWSTNSRGYRSRAYVNPSMFRDITDINTLFDGADWEDYAPVDDPEDE